MKENRTEKVQSLFTKSERELLEKYAEDSGGLSLSKAFQILAIKSLKNN